MADSLRFISTAIAAAYFPAAANLKNDIFMWSPWTAGDHAHVGAAGAGAVASSPRGSLAVQSPAHSFVPFTVPTSLQPAEPWGFT
jgi:hypothetical protein